MINYKINELFIYFCNLISEIHNYGGNIMKKLLSTFLIVPMLGLFILTENAFSKACEGDNNKPGYLKVSQMKQPTPYQPQKEQTSPGNTVPNMQKNKPKERSDMPNQLNRQIPNNMKKNTPGKADQPYTPGQKKPKKQNKGMY